MEKLTNYATWSHEKLIERVTALEEELTAKNQSSSISTSAQDKKSWKKPRTERVFDPSKYSTRLVALKIAYLGKRYNGYEFHTKNATPLPTIEEELWKALNKARLIFPEGANPLAPGEPNWEGCEYSKCGRTDKGVSAFGQVIGIRVRSNRPLGKKSSNDKNLEGTESVQGFDTYPRENAVELASPSLSPSRARISQGDVSVEEHTMEESNLESHEFDPVADEIQYPSVLNRLLPPDIRVLAWCPAPPLDFSARFSCRERQYRYFFTLPAFPPVPHHLEAPPSSSPKVKDGWLDIDAMREAARLFEGENDFRNFCKVDGGKQIQNFERTIFYSNIEEVEDMTGALGFVNGEDFHPPGTVATGFPKVYTYTLHGSAFLWHQVRHMVAVLFLVGQGLEKPSIISDLLDVKKTPRRPMYEMASDTPLVLWNCVFPHEKDPQRKDVMQWIYVGEGDGVGESKFGSGALMEDLWRVWRERKVDEILAGSLIDVVAKQGSKVSEMSLGRQNRSQKVFDGGDASRLQGVYTTVLKKPLMESVEVINERYALRKGFENSADMRAQGFRRMNPKVPALEEGDE